MNFRALIVPLVIALFAISFSPSQSSASLSLQADPLIGTISDDAPSVEFPLTIRRSETTLTLQLDVTAGDLAPLVQLVKPGGTEDQASQVLAEASGDPARMTFLVPSYGDYQLLVTRTDETSTGDFQITYSTVEEEIEANLVGVIDDTTPFITVPIEVTRTGSTIVVDLREITDGLDTKLYLVEDRTGSIIDSNDDRDKVNKDKSSFVAYPQAARGSYTIVATRYGEATGRTSGEFRLNYRINDPAPDVQDYGVQDGDLLNTGYPIEPTFEPREHTEWTILAYYGGDNNLEPGIIQDMNEFEIAGGDASVRIVLLLDRSPEDDNSNGDWKTGRVFEIGPASNDSGGERSVENPDGDYPPTIDSLPITDLGTIDSADGQLFAQFLTWGVRYFPSDNYVVALASHGAGWQGIIEDHSAGDLLSIPEMQEAYRLALGETGLDKFAFLINDACLMSSVEYMDGMSPYFDYILASPEIVVTPAHNMTLFTEQLRAIYNTPDFTAIGAALIDRYIDVDVAARQGSDIFFLTSALTDADNFDSVVQAVEQFAALMNTRNPVVIANVLGPVRTNTYTYTHFMRGNTLVDLEDMMRRVIQSPNADDEIVDAAQNVINALDAARLYQKGGERVINRIGYYNIYFPEDSADFDVDYFAALPQELTYGPDGAVTGVASPLQEWGRMLRNFYNAVTPNPWEGNSVFHTPIAPRVHVTNYYPQGEMSVETSAVFEFEIIGRNIAYADMNQDQILPDGRIMRHSAQRLLEDVFDENNEVVSINNWDSGVESAPILWDVTLPTVSDGTSTHFEMMIISEENTSIQARYCEAGYVCETDDDWKDVIITFDLEGNLQRVVSLASTTNALGVIDIPTGSTVQTYFNYVTEDGRVTLEPGNLYTWPAEGFTWDFAPAPTADYNIGMTVTAFGGTTGYANQLVHVNNDNVPEDIRAYINPYFGFSVPYLYEWITAPGSGYWIDDDENKITERAFSPDETMQTQIYWEPIEDPLGLPLVEIAENTAELYGFTILGDYTDITVDDQPALEFDLQIDYADGRTYIGRAFVVLLPVDQFGIIVSVEGLQGENVDYLKQYEITKSAVRFYDIGALDAERIANEEWEFIVPDEIAEVAFPLNKAIGDAVDFDGTWTYYAPAEEDGRFFATATLHITSEVEGVDSVVSNLLTGYASMDAEQFTITSVHTFYGLYHTWSTTTYEALFDGQWYSGRVYATSKNGKTYAAWFELPMIATEDGTYVEDIDTIRDIFEPTLDGYQIYTPEELDEQ